MTIPDFSLAGKVAVVPGSKRGIGKAIALGFAEAGADVVVSTRVLKDEEHDLETVAEDIRRLGRRSLAVQADTTRKADVDNMVKRVMDEFGAIDILFNNAAVMVRKPLFEHSEEEWDSVIDTDLKGYYLCCQAVGKVMVARKRGNIINMSSMSAVKASPTRGAYNVAKAGVSMLTRVLALELAGYNIRVNAIAPGGVKTERNRDLWSDPDSLKRVESWAPMKRLAEPDEMVGVALFLASDASSYMTGQTVIVDGGETL